MARLVELAGFAVMGAVLANVVILLTGSLVRRMGEAARLRLKLKMLRQQVGVHLEAAKVQRDRTLLSWEGVRKFVVAAKIKEAKDVYSFYLEPHDGRPLPPFAPGQHLTFRLRPPDVKQPLVRCYSLSDAPDERQRYRVSVKKVPGRNGHPPGLVSSFLADCLEQGDIIDLLAPSGQFCLDDTSDRPVVLLAGGIGITPLLSMAKALARTTTSRQCWLFYGVRNADELSFAQELAALAEQHAGFHLVVCFSQPSTSSAQGRDFHHQGWVSVELLRQTLPSSNFQYYICGPPPMMESLIADLTAWGVPVADIHFEAFGAASARPARGVGDATWEVEFARSGTTCTWSAEEGTLLDLADKAGVVIDSGCRAGSCGSCATAVRDGTVSYPINPGQAPPEGTCLVCIAQPTSKLVLDA